MTDFQAKTNETPQSCADAVCDCNTLWSMAQQYSVERLTTQTGELKGRLLKNYEVRAKRIAATYARFYLELEPGCDSMKKGRFYWMALGSFASKTVACALSLNRVKVMPWVTDGLGKGNFWLFCDISGWHWYYAKHHGTFSMCQESRNAANYAPPVMKLVQKLPWSSDALPIINQMKPSDHIRLGFAKVAEYEAQKDPRRRQAIQMDHLLAIANHEQGVVLQPLIYDKWDFSTSVAAQRAPVLNWFSPNVELVFSHACETEDQLFKSQPPEGTQIENFASRMKWINNAAKQFHELMIKKNPQMERELQAMAAWVDLPDT
jgi:hypothetical protein